LAEVVEGLLVAALALGRVGWRSGCGGAWPRRGHGRCEANPTDLEVFVEAVELEEVGEFEGADIAPTGADFALEVEDDGANVLGRVARV